MEFFTIGKQKLSKYCFGTWSIGGQLKNNMSYGDMSEIKSHKLLKYAFNKGINFFDTANVYGLAEKRIGDVFKNIREKIFIANKVGCVSFKKKLNFSTKVIKKQLDQSLKSLNTKYIDLVQLYTPDPNDKKLKQCVNYLHKKKMEGVIRFIGISLRQPADYIQLRKLYNFDAVQCNFNVLDQRVLNHEILKLMRKDKIKIFARTILNFGIFTDQFVNKKKVKFKKNDHRYKWNIKQILLWQEHIKKLKDVSNRPIESTCYRFCNSFNMSALIIGSNLKKHIDIAFNNINKKLNKEELNKINNIYKVFSRSRMLKPKIPIKQ
jgi:aryl-alcohol dehydrogenase-like predicted oxidoreductase